MRNVGSILLVEDSPDDLELTLRGLPDRARGGEVRP
jgi:hypothetical protein